MLGKRFLPQSLFGRALLILVLPTVLIQLVVAYVFFDRHWDNVSRYMSAALAGEIAFFTHQLSRVEPGRMASLARDFEVATGLDVTLLPPGKRLGATVSQEFPEFQSMLQLKLDAPFSVLKSKDGTLVHITISLPERTLRIAASIKRLESRTTTIFVVWMLGASIVFLLIAVVFLRNQIRPIRRLAEVADSFGRGGDTQEFRPSGATEVRKAGRAFIVMRERISRQLRTRTDMLAGISHDLRTPLTRMKLQLAMLPEDEAVRELSDDVQQMEHMIGEYLDFVRGAGREEAIRVSLRELVADVVRDYERMSADVTLAGGEDVALAIRPSSFRRMLHNIVDNALRYGQRCTLGLRVAANYCELVVDDEGAGIPEARRDEVFKPFTRLEQSRNAKTGGVGLGLTIARDIAMAHGGTISLGASPKGGLRVIIRLPL